MGTSELREPASRWCFRLSVSRPGASRASRWPRGRCAAGALPGRCGFVRRCSSAVCRPLDPGVSCVPFLSCVVAGPARCSPVFCRILQPAHRVSLSSARGPALTLLGGQLCSCFAATVPRGSLSGAFRSFLPCGRFPQLAPFVPFLTPVSDRIQVGRQHRYQTFARRPALAPMRL